MPFGPAIISDPFGFVAQVEEMAAETAGVLISTGKIFDI